MADGQRTSPARTRRFRFSLRQLFVAVVVVAVGLGIWNWLTRKVVEIRAARPDDEVSGFESLKSRWNAAVVTGRFLKGMSLMAELCVVRSGIADNEGIHFVGRDATESEGLWETVNIRLALGEEIVPGGRMTKLYLVGHIGAQFFVSFNNSAVMHNINVVATETLPGRITPGRPYIVYVEGDQKIVVHDKMTVEEFAKQNPGNDIVVTAELR